MSYYRQIERNQKAGFAISKAQNMPPKLAMPCGGLKMPQIHDCPTVATLKRVHTALNWQNWLRKLKSVVYFLVVLLDF